MKHLEAFTNINYKLQYLKRTFTFEYHQDCFNALVVWQLSKIFSRNFKISLVNGWLEEIHFF